MRKFQRINLAVFICLVATTCALVYVSEKMTLSTAFEKPWHLQPSIHEDSLSMKYKLSYEILGKRQVYPRFMDSSRACVVILVDSWGVANQEKILAEDFSIFLDSPHHFALHQRLANRTKHAERVEFRNSIPGSIYLLGGDSTEYNRQTYIPEIGFSESIYCPKCNDSSMIGKIDSLLAQNASNFIAWTTQGSRTGNRDSLHYALKLIADVARRHPEALFVVQGAHRPILGAPETRNLHKAHWVPVVVLNLHE